RASDRQHADVHRGRGPAAGTAGSGGRVVHRRGRSGARVSESPRSDGGEIRARSLRGRAWWEAIPDGRPGSVPGGREDRVLGPEGPPGEAAGLPDRVGG